MSWLTDNIPIVFGKTPDVTLQEMNSMKEELKNYKLDSDGWQRKYRTMAESMVANKWREKNVFASLYTQVGSKKSEIIKEVDKYRDTYLYQAIMNLLVEDSLSPSVISNDIVQIKSTNKTLQKEIKILEDRFDFDGIVVSILEDLLSYGDYILGLKGNTKDGITDIIDNINQGDIVAVHTDASRPEHFLGPKKGANQGTKLGKLNRNNYAHFCLGNRKLRIKVDHVTVEEFVRIGRPMFYGNFDLLKTLMLMTALVPASYLHKMNTSSIIGITVPETTDVKDALDICQQYENLLNKHVSVDKDGDVTVSDVLSAAGKFKAIPIYGGDRGNLQKVDPRFEEMTDISVLEDLRKSICSSIGVPYSFIYGGEGESKGETLKSFARYVRKLNSIQSAVASGLKQIVLNHLEYKNLNPNANQIEITFTNKLVNIENLDKIEFSDTLISTVKNLVESVQDVSARLKAPMDGKALSEYLKLYLKPVGLENLFDIPKEPITPPEDKGF